MQSLKGKFIALDLDGTLCSVGESIPESVIKSLKKIAKKGARLIICSGKPTYYLCGLFRQVGIKDVILVGENGATYQEGISLPPKVFYKVELEKDVCESFEILKNKIKEKLPDVWFQPNEVGLTAFYSNETEKSVIEQIIADNRLICERLKVFRHSDSFDFAPVKVDKKTALEKISKKFDLDKSQFIAIGDGENDYPMFEFCKYSFGVSVKDEKMVTKNFSNVFDCLDYVLEYFGE